MPCTYVNTFWYNRFEVLDNEAKLRVVCSKRERLCADTASSIDNY